MLWKGIEINCLASEVVEAIPEQGILRSIPESGKVLLIIIGFRKISIVSIKKRDVMNSIVSE